MHAFARAAAFVVGGSLLGGALRSASAATGEATYQELIDKAVASGTPGLQAYVRKGAAIWSGSAGVASVEDSRPMTMSQRLRLASITKTMTAALTLELVRAGKLQLSDRAVDRLPAGTLDGIPFAGEMTIAHLLEHKSGLHNFNGEDSADFYRDLFANADERRVFTAAELLAYARKPQHRPTGRPGEKKTYSSTGYVVLEMVLEHTEGKPLAHLFREKLFEPLGMQTAGVEAADFAADQIADSYARPSARDRISPSPFAKRPTVRNDGLVNLSAGLKSYNGWARGAGAVAASVDDLAKFMDAVRSGRIAVMADQAEQFARSKAKPGSYLDWNGGSWGIQSSILFEPARDITVIVLSNASNVGTSSHDLAQQLLRAARGT